MWALLSTRLRTWVLLAVAVPVVRGVLRRAGRRAAENDPTGKVTTALARADRTLAKVDRRRR